jgi:hypothetical protein
MASKAKVEANRRNVRSTGSRRAEGKARSSQNAQRHGFASVLNGASQPPERIEQMARVIAGPNQDPHRLYQARIIAEMQLKLELIALAKEGLIRLTDWRLGLKCKLAPTISAATLLCLQKLWRLERYEQRAFARCSRAIRQLNA